MEDGPLRRVVPGLGHPSPQRCNRAVELAFHLYRLPVGDTPEADGVACTKLADLPQFGLRDHRRTDESTEARSVGSQ